MGTILYGRAHGVFAKAGINMQLQNVQNGADILAAMVGRSIQIRLCEFVYLDSSLSTRRSGSVDFTGRALLVNGTDRKTCRGAKFNDQIGERPHRKDSRRPVGERYHRPGYASLADARGG
jgi:hypothetical protein